MTMSNPRGINVGPGRPRAFPIWPGLGVGLLVACGLAGLELTGAMPPSLVDLIGGAMCLAHAMIAFAVVTLIGEATLISLWERSLVEQIERDREAPALNDLLDEAIDSEAARAEVEQSDRLLTNPWRGIRLICRIVTYAVPLIGFALAASKARAEPSWSLAARPLLLTLGESAFVILLSISVANSIGVVRDGWLSVRSRADVKTARSSEPVGRPS